MKKMFVCLAILLFSQCKQQEVKDLAEIDVSQKCTEREMVLQDIASVEYIPFETNDNTLMSANFRIVYVSDNYILVTNSSNDDVFVFDGKGKSKFSFNNKGQSGMEYISLYCVAFDEKAKEIFVSNRYSAEPKFLVYNEDGKFKRSFPFPPDFSPRDLYSFDDETLLVYDEFGLNNNNYSHKPYVLLSKKDGSMVDSLGIHLPVRVSNRVTFEVEDDGQMTTGSMTLSIPNNRSYGSSFLIVDWSSDTIYRLTPKKELQPVIVRTPPVQKSDPKIILSNELATDKYIFFAKVVFDFEAAKESGPGALPAASLLYDFETGQLNEYKLMNKDYEARGVRFDVAITPENTGVYTLDVSRLLEADETGKVKGELKQLLKTLDEEDNPVLVKVRFY